jgi:hypothetical protein
MSKTYEPPALGEPGGLHDHGVVHTFEHMGRKVNVHAVGGGSYQGRMEGGHRFGHSTSIARAVDQAKRELEHSDKAFGKSMPRANQSFGDLRKAEAASRQPHSISDVRVHSERGAERAAGPDYGDVSFSAKVNGRHHEFHSEALHNDVIDHMHDAQHTGNVHPDLHEHISHMVDSGDHE